MKQLELNITLKTNNNTCELWAVPNNGDNLKLCSWYKGETIKEVVTWLLKDLCNNNIKYWFMLEDN